MMFHRQNDNFELGEVTEILLLAFRFFSNSNNSMKILNEINILHQGAALRFACVGLICVIGLHSLQRQPWESCI